MTLVKWNRNGRSNGSNQSVLQRENMPSGNSEYGTMWPRLFDTFRPFFSNDLIQDFYDDTMNLGTGTIGTTLPAVNISETDTDLVIEVAAPGMNKKDFKVEVVDNQLHIAYNKERKNEDNNQEHSHWRKEFSFESFERSFTLPAIVESDKIAASYNDGILRISITKKEEARKKPAKAIEVK
jgi:HSP20 family protein